jgi:hypothetical protein
MRFSTLHIQYYIIANYFSYIVVISMTFFISIKKMHMVSIYISCLMYLYIWFYMLYKIIVFIWYFYSKYGNQIKVACIPSVSPLFITSFTSVSPLFHLCFIFVLLSSVMFHHILCTAMHSCAQPHLVVYIFSSLHWCTPVLTLSISWSVIDARLFLAYGFPTEYWPHLVIWST